MQTPGFSFLRSMVSLLSYSAERQNVNTPILIIDNAI